MKNTDNYIPLRPTPFRRIEKIASSSRFSALGDVPLKYHRKDGESSKEGWNVSLLNSIDRSKSIYS